MARASALHAEGHRFDSDILHKIIYELRIGNYELKKQFLKKYIGNSFGSREVQILIYLQFSLVN